MRKLFTIPIIAFLIAGCSGGSSEQGAASKIIAPASMSAEAADSATPKTPKAFPRKVIYRGEVSITTEDLDGAIKKLEAKTKEFEGFIGNANITGSKGTTRTASWTIRIPSTKFDAFVGFVASIGELNSNHREAEDVSEEYYDVEARLKNKRVEEARLIDLLKRSTGKLAEILALEKEISRVREECEQIEGRLRFLTNQTDLSTVTVSMQEVKDFTPQGSPSVKTQVSRTFSGSIEAMKQVGLGLLLLVVAVLPWLVPIVFIGWLLYRFVRHASTPKGPIPPPVLPNGPETPDQK